MGAPWSNVSGKFKNLADTLGETLGGGVLGAATAVDDLGLWGTFFPFVPTQVGQASRQAPGVLRQQAADEALKLTLTPTQREYVDMWTMMGYDATMTDINQRRLAGQALTANDLEAMSQIAMVTAQMHNQTIDVTSNFNIDVLSYLTSVEEGDFSSPQGVLNWAKMVGGLDQAPAQTEQDDLAASLMEQQNLLMEQTRLDTLTARRNYEREGILSVIQMLPSGNRMQFMSSMFQQPKFAQLFFGSLDEGSNEGPYVSGVLGGMSGGGAPALPAGLSRNAVVAGAQY